MDWITSTATLFKIHKLNHFMWWTPCLVPSSKKDEWLFRKLLPANHHRHNLIWPLYTYIPAKDFVVTITFLIVSLPYINKSTNCLWIVTKPSHDKEKHLKAYITTEVTKSADGHHTWTFWMLAFHTLPLTYIPV